MSNSSIQIEHIFYEDKQGHIQMLFVLPEALHIPPELVLSWFSAGTTDNCFGGNVRWLNSDNAIQANTIDGYSRKAGIARFWKNHFRYHSRYYFKAIVDGLN